MSQWQPVESAPKDGTVIRTCQMRDDGAHFIENAAWRVASQTAPWRRAGIEHESVDHPAKRERWRTPDGDYDVPAFTHWMPRVTPRLTPHGASDLLPNDGQ